MRILTLFAILLAAGVYLYRRSALTAKQPRPEMTNEQIRQQWRQLGFFCELDEQKRAWTLTGSRAGLLRFRDLLKAYVANPLKGTESERQHYGPYGSLEIMTWPDPGFDGNAIRGSLADLARLGSLVETKLAAAQPGSVVRLREEFAADSPYALVLDVRADGFDPASADRENLGTPIQSKPEE